MGTPTKVSREQWLDAARQALATDGVDLVRIQPLAKRLGATRSSFYWYFQSRENLLDELLAAWTATNTASIVDRAARPTPTITAAVLSVFECWADVASFDPQLDAAVRSWGRRDAAVEAVVVRDDQVRVDAIAAMYDRHGVADAVIRARVLYYTQIGYYALGIDQPNSVRLADAAPYVRALTGQAPTAAELRGFAQFLDRIESRNP
jgi:AcrR family transcriptional regulator